MILFLEKKLDAIMFINRGGPRKPATLRWNSLRQRFRTINYRSKEFQVGWGKVAKAKCSKW